MFVGAFEGEGVGSLALSIYLPKKFQFIADYLTSELMLQYPPKLTIEKEWDVDEETLPERSACVRQS